MKNSKPVAMSRVVRGGFPDRQFDVDFWQAQGDEAIFDAAWELVELAHEARGLRVELKDDFKDLLRLFNRHQVTFLLVGGYAVMKYTEPFYTKDMDIWIDATLENAKKTYAALVEFGAPLADLTLEDLTQPKIVFQFGMPPARIDVMTSIEALTFTDAWTNRVESQLGGIPVFVIALQDLIRNKEAVSRDRDKLHLADLRKYGKQ